MTAIRYNMSDNKSSTPLPISAVIRAANRFGCDIYIKSDENRFNVKDYDELQKGMQFQRRWIIFYFEGTDEKEANRSFRILFGV